MANLYCTTTTRKGKTMRSTKKKKSVKTKPANLRVRDLRPAKDARAGAQKKEAPNLLGVMSPSG
jgi:hypothetical protein